MVTLYLGNRCDLDSDTQSLSLICILVIDMAVSEVLVTGQDTLQ